MPKIDPIRPTESVFSWIIVNREGVLVGALVAAAIVAVMLVARMIGHRIVAKEAETPTFGWKAIVGRVLRRPTSSSWYAAIDIVATYAHRRRSCAAAGRHRLHDQLRLARSDLGRE